MLSLHLINKNGDFNYISKGFDFNILFINTKIIGVFSYYINLYGIIVRSIVMYGLL